MGKRKCQVCAPNTCLDAPKPKRKRLDTRVAGLEQAARVVRRMADSNRSYAEKHGGDFYYRDKANEDIAIARELERLARAEARRGGAK